MSSRAIIKSDMPAPLGIAHYDAMCKAITLAVGIDEVRELRSKARALEVYAAQAQNVDAERKAAEIRLRAERRAGELLIEMKGSGQLQKQGDSGGNRKQTSGSPTSAPAAKLADLGITRDQSSKWQQLAAVPKEHFEKAVKSPGPAPSTEGIINSHRIEKSPAPRIDPDALWLWGRLREFESSGILERGRRELAALMTPNMREDCDRITPVVGAWLQGRK